MNKSFKHYEIANATDVGKVRRVNEDYYGTIETLNGEVVVVCDGMGGHAGGETASRLAVESIIASLNRKLSVDPLNALNEALLYANQIILEYAHEHPGLKGMGSTCVVLLLRDNCCYYGHVGDSRIYIYTKNHLQQLTKDHSFVQSLVDAGAISLKDAESHPRKNEITNALGLERMRPPSLCQKPYKPRQGDIMLLCTDGLTGMVSDEQIQELLGLDMALYDKAKELVVQANRAGGIDNITLQLVQFSGSGLAKSGKGDTIKVNKRVLQVAGVTLFLLSLLGAIALMASGGLSVGGIGQKIAILLHHENVVVPPKTALGVTVVPLAQNRNNGLERDSLLQAKLKKVEGERDSARAEAQRSQQKERDAKQEVAALAKIKNDREAALLNAKIAVDARQAAEAAMLHPGVEKVIKIGDEYGGGTVFYVNAAGKHGLIAAKSDLSGHSTGTDEKLAGLFFWSDAKNACNVFAVGDYNNWRLPSREELKKLCLKKSIVGGFTNSRYWSASAKDGRSAWIMDFGSGNEHHDKKKIAYRVRPIRSF
jgi:PPM family protein phosphatase